jgi:hypothetical protein
MPIETPRRGVCTGIGIATWGKTATFSEQKQRTSRLEFIDLIVGFKEAGLAPGDTVLVHSSYKSFGGVANDKRVLNGPGG